MALPHTVNTKWNQRKKNNHVIFNFVQNAFNLDTFRSSVSKRDDCSFCIVGHIAACCMTFSVLRPH